MWLDIVWLVFGMCDKFSHVLNNKPFDIHCQTIFVAATSLKHLAVVNPIQQSSLPICYFCCLLIMNHQKQHFHHFSKQGASKVSQDPFKEFQICSISGYVEHQFSVLMHHQILSMFNLSLNFQLCFSFTVLCYWLNSCVLHLQRPFRMTSMCAQSRCTSELSYVSEL